MVVLLHMMSVQVTEFERLSSDYPNCLDFGEIFTSLLKDPTTRNPDYLLKDGHLFKGTRLCVP
ncbi:hypothetical protein AXF42_Ash013520 [Apostasia shenzhenica]|uniref:Uncharacterized protein n=1 Tax=Apostasia shenzhenica TaxID=1088818 RepID=A0A2I0A4F5_9ASPA|nr:hypothetical protein AXF42_Ash013520 [Apostasia shenzhenica]